MTYVAALFHGHDGSLAIVGEGRIVHLQAERFSRVRHDTRYDPTQLYQRALDEMGITDGDVTCVVGVSGAFGASKGGWERMDEYVVGQRDAFGRSREVYSIPHHLAHLGYAFYTSPYEIARLVALDGGGDAHLVPFWHEPKTATCAVGAAIHRFGETCERFDAEWVSDPHVGGSWIAASMKCFGREFCEGKVMALVGVPEAQFATITGQPQERWTQLQRLQRMTTDAIHRLVPANTVGPVALAGGCALNGIAVYDLLRRNDVTAVHVPPACDDSGITVGAALYVLHRILDVPRVRYSTETVAFAGMTEPTLDAEPPVELIAEYLAEGKVVALVHGRAESGPRALGHRSILADPRRPEMKDKLNRIKGRELWRPVAPVVAQYGEQDMCGEYFDLINPDCYRYMTTIAGATQRARQEIPAAVHYDGSARVQTVSWSSTLGRIIGLFHERTKVPVLLNTSFNVAGEAMVNDTSQAWDTFGRAPEIDVLVCGDWVVDRWRDSVAAA